MASKKKKSKKPADTIKVFDPKTGKVFDEVAQTPVTKIPAIYEELVEGQKQWASISLKNRQKLILGVRDWVLNNIEDLALLISKDNGKSDTEAIIAEIYPIIDLIDHFGKKAHHYLEDQKIKLNSLLLWNKKSFLAHQARGPVLVISPWNYAFSIPMGEIIFALLVGNSVLLKASSETPLVGLKMLEILRAAGIPKYAFQVAMGPGRTVGKAILEHRWAHISFTGSVKTGKQVMAKAAKHLTPVKMELGGKDPMIVCADADLERAANGAIWGAFTNAGQTCASVERVYVEKVVAQKFIDLVVDKTNKLRNYLDSPSDYEVGPMTVKSQYEIVLKHIREAKKKNASILTGGLPEKRANGWFIPPTVIIGVDHSFNLMIEETFGPTLPIMEVKDVDEAIELANDSVFGLTASIWTRSRYKGIKLARKIEAGTVFVNDCLYSHGLKETPWMGIKDSGFGIAHSKWGLEEMAQKKHINFDIFPGKRNLWWYPYGKPMYDAIKGASRFTVNKLRLGSLGKVLKLVKKMYSNF